MKFRLIIENSNIKKDNDYEVFSGNPDSIVRQMRMSAFNGLNITDRKYIADFARRHNNIYKHKVIGMSNQLFVLSMIGSPICKSVELLINGKGITLWMNT